MTQEIESEERFVVDYFEPDPKKKPVWGNIRGWFLTEARARGYIDEYNLKGAKVRRVFMEVSPK